MANSECFDLLNRVNLVLFRRNCWLKRASSLGILLYIRSWSFEPHHFQTTLVAMNTAHLHLILNHAPIFATMFALVLIALSMAGSDRPQTTSSGLKLIGASNVGARAMLLRIGLWTLVAGAALAIPAFLTGEPAEEAVEHAAGVSENMIDAHESVAKFSLIFSSVLGLGALGALLRMRRALLTQPIVLGLLMLTLASAGSFAYTAYQGGQIRHSEIAASSGAGNQNAPEPGGQEQGEKDED